MNKIRINKYLAECGVASRRGSDALIEEGKVKINGKIAATGADIDEDTDVITVLDKVIARPYEYTYVMLNKPKGYITSANDDKGRKTVMDLLKFDKVRLFPVGRLDYDTEGLLLLTNDGELTQKLTHPKNEIGKTYVLTIGGGLDTESLFSLKKGVEIDSGKTGKSFVKILKSSKEETRLEITIFEGKNRQIKKMMESVGKEVKFLKRIKIGEIRLGGLNRGEYRNLTKSEVRYLKNL